MRNEEEGQQGDLKAREGEIFIVLLPFLSSPLDLLSQCHFPPSWVWIYDLAFVSHAII